GSPARGRRQRRQHGLFRRADGRRDATDRLHRKQGRSPVADEGDRGGVRPPQHPRQRVMPGPGGYPPDGGAPRRSGAPRPPHGPHSLRPPREGFRGRPCRPLPRLRRLLLHQRSRPHRGRRDHRGLHHAGVNEEEVLRRDAEDLKRLGYTQQLLREMGGFSNFAVSFSIISVLTGAVLLYGYGLKLAGPIVNTVGWPVASIFTLAIAASMAELASAYPTAGGLYFWSFRLGGRGWAWITAWLNMVGQVTITAGINVAAAIYLIGAATRILGLPADLRVPVFGPVTSWGFQLF